MKKELLISLLLATASLTASLECAAQWQDISNDVPAAPPEELRAQAAAAAAPGAIPAAQPAADAPRPAAKPAPVPVQTYTPTPVGAVQSDVLPAPVSAPPDEGKSLTPVIATPKIERAAKMNSIVLHPSTLRTRPMASSTGDRIDAETAVRMESTITNSDGTWWFVTATGIGGGWMLEKELGDPRP